MISRGVIGTGTLCVRLGPCTPRVFVVCGRCGGGGCAGGGGVPAGGAVCVYVPALSWYVCGGVSLGGSGGYIQ